MAETSKPVAPKLIHVGKIFPQGGMQWVFLRQISEHLFQWFYAASEEIATGVTADSVQEAMRLAFRTWKMVYFTTLNCGFRYTLPERDEHGINALFHQMIASLSSPNGIYFDEELGHLCFVQNASIEARDLWKQLQINGKL